jgi:A/G-specific adenine glycosylase
LPISRTNDQDAAFWLLDPSPLEELDQSSQQAALHLFSDHIWSYYRHEQRNFPWRETDDPYKILLSELMLQQTQTERVLPKYSLFLEQWPDFKAMAQASIAEVIAAWRGLGYNRRALALRTIAQQSESFGWTLPNDYDELLKLPMIGPATAAAICAFSYREPAIYLETNIRRVLIHQFHPHEDRVSDTSLRRELRELLQFQVDYKQWYYALMDYGVYLKRVLVNPNRKSAHYTKQAKFAGSNRQIRGLLLLVFTEQGLLPLEELCNRIPFPRERIEQCLQSLISEGFVHTYMQTAEEPQIRYGIPSD